MSGGESGGMNQHINPDKGILRVAPGTECHEMSVGANVTQLAFAGGAVLAGLGDGRVVSVAQGAVTTLARHTGAVTGLVADAGGGVVSAGQDGRVLRHAAGETCDLAPPKSDWITALRVSPDGSRIAIASGKRVEVLAGGETVARLDDFPSTVSDIAFFATGDRLAISHYNGLSLWQPERLARPEKLTWAGSMTQASVAPDGRYVAGATQDREIHVWDLVTDRDFRLGGYQRKVKAIGWTTDAAYLYTTGADVLVAWSLASDPGTVPPKEIGYAFAQTVSAIVPAAASTCLPAGFTDGSIMIGEAQKGTAKIVRAPKGAAITAFAPAAQGGFCFGSAAGDVGLFRAASA